MTDPTGETTAGTTAAAHPDEELRLSLPADDASLDLVHDALSALLARHGVDGRDAARFETGVVEILGNIVEHAFEDAAADPGSEARRLLDVVARVEPDRLLAVLGDNGLPAALDLSAVTMPVDLEAESGRGLALALAAVDDLRYERVGDRNSWSLTCRRS